MQKYPNKLWTTSHQVLKNDDIEHLFQIRIHNVIYVVGQRGKLKLEEVFNTKIVQCIFQCNRYHLKAILL